MSSTEEQEAKSNACASCGIEENETAHKMCPCNLVKYCSVECQHDHRPQHKNACKKRMAELRDKVLFAQPEISHLGECPICCLPLPLDASKLRMMACCSKNICSGCQYANRMREREQRLQPKCPFCRHAEPRSQAEADQNNLKRVEANDPYAIAELGKNCRDAGDCEGAVKYFKKAAELGNVNAHVELAIFYDTGVIYNKGVGRVEKSHKKFVHHLEEAAIRGHVTARCDLGGLEQRKGNEERMIKHFIIAAKLGDPPAMNVVKAMSTLGTVSEEDYASTLRQHQAAVDATKSAQREEADAFYARQRRR